MSQIGNALGTAAGMIFGGRSPRSGGLGQIAVNTGAYGLSAVPGEDNSMSVALTEKPTAELTNRLMRQARTYSDLDMLRSKVTPGFGAITDARVAAIRNAASSARSNLRDSLAQRRIAGSRFGDDAISSLMAEMGQQESAARAQGLLEEIATTSQLLEQENKYLQQDVQKNLAELGVAAGFAGGVTSAMNTQLAIDKQLAAQNSSGLGKALGSLGSNLFGGIQQLGGFDWAKGLFSGGGPSAMQVAGNNAYYNPDIA